MTFRHILILSLSIFLFQSFSPVLAQNLNAEKLQQFEDAVLRGEEFLGARKYAEAKAQYQAALKIDPTAQFPKDKLAQIRKFYIDPEDETRFTQFMQAADQRMVEKNYTEALKGYEAALDIKPEDKAARDKMTQASKLLLELAERTKSYDALIKKADAFLAANKPVEARESYVSALELLPEQSYAQQKINEIDSKAATAKARDDAYDKALTQGDEAYMDRDFVTAKIQYEQALKIKPGESYPTNMLERVSSGSTQAKNQMEQYAQTIEAADRLMTKGDHQGALAAYEDAAKLQPNEKYPPAQIEKIRAMAEQKEKLEHDYQQAITEGDRLYSAQKLIEARAEFQQANNLKPAEAYPKQKIEEIAQALLALKDAERNKKYLETIEKAEKSFADKEYTAAISSFEEARQLKPDETLPETRIREINSMIAGQKEAEQAYATVIAEADKQFQSKNYDAARVEYVRGLELRKNDVYASGQIVKVDAALAELKLKEEQYQQAIADGDRFFTNKNMAEAKKEYTAASGIFADRAYPKDKLKEIENQLNEQRSKEEHYAGLISEADVFYAASNYENASAKYKQALELKPGETHPQEQLKKIDQALIAQAELQSSYQKAITRADELVEKDKLEEAVKAYTEALALIPAETYPGERISSINQLIEDRKSLEKNYAGYVTEGDRAFASKEYQASKQAYQHALGLKPAETHPKQQIALIDKALENEQQQDGNYRQAIAEADRLFEGGKLEAASEQYTVAGKIKPAETYPEERKELIRTMLANQAQLEQDFSKAVTEADRLFDAKDYAAAKTKYQQALEFKPGATQPTARLATISQLLNEQAATDQQYQSAITLGDEQLNQQQWEEAEAAFQQAKTLKPQEKYPLEQLSRIEQMRSQAKAKAAAYASAISAGDEAFDAKDYTAATNAYQRALENQPGSPYPTNRLEEISTLLSAQKELADKGYNEAIEQADRLFAEKDYTTAVRIYENASALKPAESYPKEKILSIRTLLQERSRNQMEAYNKLIINADRLYQDKVLDQAIEAYLEAGLAKPDEAYPTVMIAKIRKYLEDHAMVNLVNSAIEVGSDQEVKFNFTPIEMRLRKNNYVSIIARKTSEADPKVYVNYGKGGQKNGGIVLRSVTSDENGDFLVRVSIQDRWYREDNNWIAIYSEGGSIEISKMQIAQGD